LKELPNGFRGLSAKAVAIESLPDCQKNSIREGILSSKANRPENVYGVTLYVVEAIDSDNNCTIPIGYRFGDYSDLVDIQVEAATENGRQAELINMLNKEL
jgi:hypothetical protein